MSPKDKRQEWCRACFDAYLRQRLPLSQPIEWQEGHDPPDYYLTAGSQKFAVEVTTIADKIDVGSGEEIEREKLVEYRKRLVLEVEDEARQQGILQGSYHVKFAPLLPPQFDLHIHRRQIKHRLLLYIKETQDGSAHPEQTIEIERTRYCSIQKVSSLPLRVWVPWEPWTLRWEADALSKACEWLQSAIRTKAEKLSRAIEQLGTRLPKILLVFHDFDALDLTVYERCLLYPGDLRDYHTIAIVSKDKRVLILYTVDEDWKS
jgi:hypothetical protein